MKFKVVVTRQWTEYGEVELEAADEDEAREVVKEMLSDGNETMIEWSDSMDPGSDDIESVEAIE